MKLRHLLPPALIVAVLALTAFAGQPSPASASAAGASCCPSGACCPTGGCCLLPAMPAQH